MVVGSAFVGDMMCPSSFVVVVAVAEFVVTSNTAFGGIGGSVGGCKGGIVRGRVCSILTSITGDGGGGVVRTAAAAAAVTDAARSSVPPVRRMVASTDGDGKSDDDGVGSFRGEDVSRPVTTLLTPL